MPLAERAIDLVTEDLITRLRADDASARAELRALVAKDVSPLVGIAPYTPSSPTLPWPHPFFVPCITSDPPPFWDSGIRCDTSTAVARVVMSN